MCAPITRSGIHANSLLTAAFHPDLNCSCRSHPDRDASEQVESLIDEEYWKTNNWIKRVCDVQRRDRDNVKTDDEFVFGGSGGPPCCS